MVAIIRIAGFVMIVIGILLIFAAVAEKSGITLAYAGIGITFVGFILNIVLLFHKKPTDSGQPQSINTPFG